MANEYDKILKENLEAVFLPLTKKILKINCEYMEEIPDDLQTTIERARRTDLTTFEKLSNLHTSKVV